MTSLYVHESGTQGAPAVILLHGAGVSSWIWEEQVKHLEDYHCLAVDLPGHGKSNQQPWLSYSDTASQVAEIIQQRTTTGKAYIVGLSLGSYVTQHLIARFPQVVDRAILTGTTVSPLPNPAMILMMMRAMSFIIKTEPMIKFNAKVLHLPDDVYHAYAENMRLMSRKAFVRIYEETVYYQMPPELKDRHTPTLVVAGENELGLVKNSTRILRETMPCAQGYIVPGVGHGWNGEAPELFNAMIRAWITGTPLPADLTPVEAVAK